VTQAQGGALEVCHALWIGPHLGPLGHACLRSFVHAGHRVVLHAYEAIDDVPAGVELADASAIVPRERVFRHVGTGSYALFSDYFRYALLQRGLGLYVDCDVVCVRPIEHAGDYVIGFQSADVLNGAVMKQPPNSPLLADLLALFEPGVFAPPWYPWPLRLKQYAKAVLGRPTDLQHAPWGSAGPTALTYLARKHGVTRFAAPVDVFYPVPHDQAARFLDPNVRAEWLITERTRCVHLWNEVLRECDFPRAPAGSLVQRLLADEWPPVLTVNAG
jgi:hypothetical protein